MSDVLHGHTEAEIRGRPGQVATPAMTFSRLAWCGLVVVALHNAEEALTIPTWLPARLEELETRFHMRPLAADTDRLYPGLIMATLLPVIWVALTARSGPRSIGTYSILVLYGFFLANAIMPHLAGSLVLGGYTPGVITAGLLLVPFSAWLGFRAVADGYASKWGLCVSLLVAVALYIPACAALLGMR